LAESQPTVFVGRLKELNQLLDSLYKERRSVTIISSESGMGKSALLSRLYGELKEKEKGSTSSAREFMTSFSNNFIQASALTMSPAVISL
jgi:ABC-type lipoprotein export system ATPase subunit